MQLVWSKHYDAKVPHAAREMGSFWWKDVLRLSIIFRRIAKCELGDGSSACFWEDLWSELVLSQDYPRLVSFATNGAISAMEAMQAEDLDSLFFLPLSQQAFQEFEDLQARLQLITYDDTAIDQWVPIWGNKYTSRRFTPTFLAMCNPIQSSRRSRNPNAPHASSSLLG